MIAKALAAGLIVGGGGLTPDEDKPEFRGPIQSHPFDQPGPLVPFPKDEAIHACHARSVHEVTVVRGLDLEPMRYEAARIDALIWRVSGLFAGQHGQEAHVECVVNSERVEAFFLK
ncbi:MAG: hypothetical protein ACPGGK_14190 [Pikeienuella sp.]